MDSEENSVFIGLTNPKSPTNVGAVMRAAGCYKADGVFYTGQRYARAAKFATDTKNVSSKIPLFAVDSFDRHVIEQQIKDVKLVCVDLVEGSEPLPNFNHPDNALYVFGPEDGSLSQHIVDQADFVVYVPTHGCMNLAATVNVVLYDRLAKSDDMIANDELIKQSRDTNNQVKINRL